jgi:hypothetical protein
MPKPAPIRILAPTKQTGDLFTRLVSDLFLALGYDAPRLNIHKTGREIDVEARHRTESRIVLAECKATAKPIGGGDVNKFAGAVDAERRRNAGKDLAAYFVSLSGFTETALEQERDFGGAPRLVLLDGKRVAEELVHGRIVVSPGKALERAGRVANAHPDLTPDDPPQLLAHEIGWIWAVRFRRNAQVTHVALVHADGELLAPDLAKQVLASDRAGKGDLHRLTYLPPPEPQPKQEIRLDEARQAYFRYLAAECGELELEGLPADQEIGTRRLRLESLFVPLHLQAMKVQEEEVEGQEKEKEKKKEKTEDERLIVGTALERRARLAILALPGGGKTTLLKRLAVAYAFPERRSDLGDHLPDREWFPLLLRCRQLGGRAGEPITELLVQVGVWAELGDLTDAFRSLIHSLLREGRALLLVDGLDEIADPGLRVAFVTRLRTFLSTYPGVDVVITSREAGFRVVAGALSAHCDHYRIADFDQEDIERLTVVWHREVVGDRKEIEEQARALANSIWETDRVRRLAVNPLLLTTLLLVRRWVGQLPSRRSVLYEKAIEVLLMTWNLQGFEPLDLHEVKPQLAFLAWQMMEERAQRISEPRLKEILRDARRQMPEVLSYARMGVDEFVERVERRSGVMVLSGHSLENGRLVPIYEFRHLTFQEYLASQALVEGNYPNRSDQDTLVSRLEPHLDDEAWREVISLVAVLAGRKAAPLIEVLTKQVEVIREDGKFETSTIRVNLLAQCILDEVQIPPGLLERAFEALMKKRAASIGEKDSPVYLLALSRYGTLLREVVWRTLSSSCQDLLALLDAWRVLSIAEWKYPIAWQQFDELWLKGDPVSRITTLMLVTSAQVDSDLSLLKKDRTYLVSYASEGIRSSDIREQVAGAWALGVLARAGAISLDAAPQLIERLFELWSPSGIGDLRTAARWALKFMPVVARGLVRVPAQGEIEDFNKGSGAHAEIWATEDQVLALITLFYASSTDLNQEIANRARALYERSSSEGRRMLSTILTQIDEDITAAPAS